MNYTVQNRSSFVCMVAKIIAFVCAKWNRSCQELGQA